MSAQKTQAELLDIRETTGIEAKKPRVVFLDNLRVAVISLVVFYHGGQAYVSFYTGWPVSQPDIPGINNWVLGIFFSACSAFFMALLFLISAYFLPASFDRKGPSRYFSDRLIRLGLPLAFFMFLIFPLFGMLSSGKSPADFLLNTYFNFSGSGDFTFGHTWFVALLLIFSGAYAAYRILAPSVKTIRVKVPGNLAILGFTVALALLLFAVRIVSPPGDWALFHLFEPARLPAYAAMFLAGIIAYRNGWLDQIPVSAAKIWGAAAIVAILLAPLIIIFVGDGQDLWAHGFSLASLVVSAWDALLCIGISVSLLVLFREKFNSRGKVLKAMAEDSFAVYLIHPFILMVIQGILLSIDIHPLVKVVLVGIIGLPLCFSLAHLIRKMPYVARVV